MSISFLYFFHIPKTPLTSYYLYFLSPTKTTFIFMIQKFLSASTSLSPLGTTLKFLTGVLPSASNTSLQTHLHFWLEYWPLHPTLLYRHTCTSDLSIALYIFKKPLYTTCISDLIFPPCIQPIFILFTFLPYILPSTFNPLYTAYISFKYCTSHPTPIHTIYIFDLSIALYIQPPLYITFIISDLSIGLYIQPLFTLLSFLFRVLPSAPNPSLHHLHFWLEYCPLHLSLFTPL